MSSAKNLYFYDGFVVDRGLTVLACKHHEDEGDDVSRLAFVENVANVENGEWSYADFLDDGAVSVTCLRESRESFFLGHNGYVLVIEQGRQVMETLPDKEGLGYVLRIRAVGQDIYVCGMTGQIYARTDGQWRHIDHGLLGTDGLDFEDIDGTSGNDLYAVGMFGAIYHFNGLQWKRCDSPTNAHLSNVRCTADGLVYVCGKKGTVLRGNKDGWEFIGDAGVKRNFWGMEHFGNQMYLAYPVGIMRHDGEKLANVEIPNILARDFHRLHSGDGVLWSIGIDNLAYFDGFDWAPVRCPLNQ